jgi:hypothetical protein
VISLARVKKTLRGSTVVSRRKLLNILQVEESSRLFVYDLQCLAI